MKTEEIICPKCNGRGTCQIVPYLSHVSVLAFVAGGIILSLLWSGSRPTVLKCSECNHRFSQRTRGAQAFLIAFWTVIGILGLGLLCWILIPR